MSFAHPLVVLVKTGSDKSQPRVGISVSRFVGNAVARNYIKRIIREIIRPRLGLMLQCGDLVFVARQPIVKASFAEVEQAIVEVMRRSGAINA